MTAQPIAHIGFELPWPLALAHDATGYCAAEMAIEAANASGSLPFRVELRLINDGRDPAQARRVAAEFVADPTAVGVLGPLNSPMALANQDVYHAGGLAQISAEATSPLLTQRGYANFFRLVAGDERQGRAQAQIAVRYIKAQRIVVLHDGSGWGAPLAEVFAGEAAALGSPPVLVMGFGEAEQRRNFDAMAAATLRAAPDLVFFAVYWNPAHILAHQLRYAGLKAAFLGTDALKSYPYLEVPGLDAVHPYHTFAGCDIRTTLAARQFYFDVLARYPLTHVNLQYAAEAYDAALLLIEALRRAGRVDRAAVLAELQALGRAGFRGLTGLIRFDEKGDLLDPQIGLYRCEDGLRKYMGAVDELLA
jgi:branched-chain amino acid transport system substrate-binding protein